jgi:two-component system response regulator RegA
MNQQPERAVLVVDDDDIFRRRLARAMASRGWEASEASNADAALEQAAKHSPDLAIVDLRLPETSGLEIVRRLRELDDTICIIMLTGYGSIATALTATKLGADHYLTKPADADQIVREYERIVSGQEISTDVPLDAPTPSLARVEWEHIQRVLADCDGNISQAAKVLGLHRRSLQRKLFKFPPAV